MAVASNNLETLITEHDVARVVGMSVASVQRWRLKRQGPMYLKIGAAVRYRPEDLKAWIDSRPMYPQRFMGRERIKNGTSSLG